jgi:hypothetical protein
MSEFVRQVGSRGARIGEGDFRMSDFRGSLTPARSIDVTVDSRGPYGWSQCDARGSVPVANAARRDGGCSISARIPTTGDSGPALGACLSTRRS